MIFKMAWYERLKLRYLSWVIGDRAVIANVKIEGGKITGRTLPIHVFGKGTTLCENYFDVVKDVDRTV